MVDSNDRDRVVEARDELHRMLNEVIGNISCSIQLEFSCIPIMNNICVEKLTFSFSLLHSVGAGRLRPSSTSNHPPPFSGNKIYQMTV